MELYPRPGPINNRELLRQEAISDLANFNPELELKENLLEHHDYIGVNKKVYDVLANWYGADFEICRVLRPDPFQQDKTYLELYPSNYYYKILGFANIYAFLEKRLSGKSAIPKSFDANAGINYDNVLRSIINCNLGQN